jgi:hypothetical protein
MGTQARTLLLWLVLLLCGATRAQAGISSLPAAPRASDGPVLLLAVRFKHEILHAIALPPPPLAGVGPTARPRPGGCEAARRDGPVPGRTPGGTVYVYMSLRR